MIYIKKKKNRVVTPIGKLSKVGLIYFAGFKCTLEDCYRYEHIHIRSSLILC